MAENVFGKKRRIKIPETEREYWRRVFFDEVHSRMRIQNLIEQDLRPLWRNLDHDIDVPNDWHGLLGFAKEVQAGRLVIPSRVAYRARLDEVVRDTLRCRKAGAHALWMVAYLKGAVEDRLPDGPFYPFLDEDEQAVLGQRPFFDAFAFAPNGEPDPLFEYQMIVRMGPYEATLDSCGRDITKEDWRALPNFFEEFLDPTGRWDDWENFSERAHAILEAGLQHMRSEYERRNPEQVNVRKDDALHDDAKALAAYLVDRTPLSPDRAQRERLRRFAARIGLDFPVD